MKNVEYTEENMDKYMKPNSPKFPIMHDGLLYEEKDCHEDFLDLYEGKFMLGFDGGIYLCDGMYMYPDGNMGDEEI